MRATSVLPTVEATFREVEQRGRAGVLSPAAWADIPGIREHFTDESRLLAHLQQRWLHTLAAEVEHALELGAGELRDDVRQAYRRAVVRRRGLRRVLDANEHHPAVAAGRRREHELLCRAAGVHSVEQLVCREDEVPVEVPASPRRRGRIAWLALFRQQVPTVDDVPGARARLDGSLSI